MNLIQSNSTLLKQLQHVYYCTQAVENRCVHAKHSALKQTRCQKDLFERIYRTSVKNTIERLHNKWLVEAFLGIPKSRAAAYMRDVFWL